MKHTIAIINQKGGVGKSTTAHAIGAGLAESGKRVLFIDLDAQGNLSYAMGADPSRPGAMEVLTREKTIAETIQKIPRGDALSSSPALFGADASIADIGKEFRLKEALACIKNEYDNIIIDTPPALGILTINALSASDGIIIPSSADIYSLQGIASLANTISAIRQYCNPTLEICGVLLTRHNPRTVLSRDMADNLNNLASKVGTRVFSAYIRECISLREAQASRTDIFSYAPNSNAAFDYAALLQELV